MSSFQDVIDRANTDQPFRTRLKANPESVCKEASVEIPQKATFEVIESSRNDLHLLLGSRTSVPDIDRILERADEDAAFRKQLVSNPREAIEAATGEKVPATCKVHVREADPNKIYLFLGKPQEADVELSEDELAGVAGGNPVAVGMIIGSLITGATVIGLSRGVAADAIKLAKDYAGQKGKKPA